MSKIDASAPIADIGKQALVEIINRSFSAVDKAVDFATAQLPDVIYQLLLWKAVWSFMVMVMCIATVCVLVLLSKKLSVITYGGIWILSTTVNVAIAYPFFAIGFDWLQIILAPKIYLLEYAVELAK